MKLFDRIYRILCWMDNVKPYRHKLPKSYIKDKNTKTI